MWVWILYQSLWQKWNFIFGDSILCKHYPKWNAYTYPSKYWVVLKFSQNETSYEQNLFLRLFKISNRYEFISPLMWRYSYCSLLEIFLIIGKVPPWKIFFFFKKKKTYSSWRSRSLKLFKLLHRHVTHS